ncbi:bifunctional phosphopantothenoylcysteine decarboxylase/phosphopantothenate--cysteine ligase CoaBC [Dyadobacter chenwenxiniae]|uniref:Coenzyme A biosynthesis bifunctional protein CoaBC n=1 Tax=Dyadobacter chenwenxiniae TaxID=2906456 RepID=A0A9X1TDR6_9BACT|nr:bifunctional phosphopantothenoylcysteine decarboxylase/phosphopantothenate--cysteine ligase CoaBC [Dyadobacter chenwenxiniae]MCF0060670.1 bifunctional phosphopantothenoylcysteine decarboxylase/phosphopantothenate--cysteine ligase CoaBC [Dyadobacter chenwenxiniae]UON80504.1 bifunctional phosphopantothenoylcysteine decarboxylase/phosphopantothenate--cysteine ligase CoaBC [Dyadobacter chenwenxiniae]
MNLKGKKILVAVSGSIAAYKSALLVRLLVKAAAEVQVVMTKSAKEFITPLTLSVLSKKPVLSTFTDGEEGTWNNHVELGLWADAIIVAPATARTLSKCATGNCDDLLTAVYLSARCPVFFAPAMDVDMYQHPSTRQNIEALIRFGNHFIEAEHGELASGLIGDGRLAEPETIVRTLSVFFAKKAVASGKRVLITAGPTVEALDPVRYISNRSSGKMGYAIAEAFAASGAMVTLVSGPTSLPIPEPTIQRINVQSADEMFTATHEHFAESDVVIFAAAVADYTSKFVAANKIKKQGEEMALDLVKTRDIAGTLGKSKTENQLLIGFALETENEMEYAMDKLLRKNFDYIILNSLNDPGAGFAHDTNKITVIDKRKNVKHFDLKHKEEVAQDILNIVLNKWSEA